MSNNEEKLGFKGVAILGGIIALFIFCWNIAYDIIGYPHGSEYVFVFLLTLVLFAVAVGIIAAIGSAFTGDKTKPSDNES
jgi:multisubunit Na+/H+ antiporter MnhB subunit